jgi:hypothetical protein
MSMTTMKRATSTLVAAVVALLVYAGVAWFASGIAIPPDAPTARLPWLWPFRVVATLGFAIASRFHVSHLVGDYLATILLGLLLGAVFAVARLALRAGAPDGLA